MTRENEKKKWLTARMILAIAVMALAVLGLGLVATGVDTDSSADLPAPTAANYDFTAPSAADLVYSGVAKTFTVTPKTGAGAVTATHYYSDESCTVSATPKDVGTYYIAVDVSAGTEYGAVNGLHDAAWTFAITAYGLDVGSLTATYTGTPTLKVNDFPGVGTETVTIKCNAPNYIVGTYTYVSGSPTSGQFSAEVEGNTNYVVSGGTKLTVNPASFVDATFSLTSSSALYTGSPISVSVSSVTLSGFTIVSSDYDINTPADMTSIGNKTITLTGKGNFTGTTTASQTFTITGTTITGVSIKVGEKFEFNNTNIVPGFSQLVITSSGGTVTASDVTITASNNKNAGTATVTVTGNASASFVGSASCNFTIVPFDLTITSYTSSKTYNGTALTSNSVTFSREIPAGEHIGYNCTGTITNVGSTSNDFTYYAYGVTVIANYNVTQSYGTLTVIPATISGTLVQDGDLTYTGSAQTASVDGLTTVNSQELTIKYNTDGSSTYGDMPAFTNADSYTVYYKATAPNHSDKTGTLTVTIDKATQSPSMSDVSNFVYGTSKSVSVTGLKETPFVSYKVDSGSGVTVKPATGELTWVSAGSTTIKATIGTTTNYEGGYITCTVTTVKATPIVSPVPAAISGLKYTGSAMDLITAGTTTGGTLQYKVDSGSYGTAIPKGTAATTYNVYYKVAGNSYYNDLAESAAISVTIGKGEQDISYGTTTVNKTYGDGAFTNTLTKTKVDGAITYTSSAPAVASVNATTGEVTILKSGSTTITATAAATGNYNAKSASYTLNVSLAAGSVTNIQDLSKTYDGEAVDDPTYNSLSGGAATIEFKLLPSGTYSTTNPTNAGSYRVKVTVAADDKYASAYAEKDFTISKAAQSPTMDDVTFTYGVPTSVVITGLKETPTLFYELTNGTYATINYSNGALTWVSAGGPVTATVTYSATDNYEAGSKTCSVTTVKANPTITIEPKTGLKYTGSSQELLTTGTTSGGTIYFRYDMQSKPSTPPYSTEYSTDIPSGTIAGTYLLFVKVDGDEHYNGVSGYYHGYIEMAKGTITGITTGYNPTYIGTEQTPGKSDLAYTNFSARPDDAKVTIAKAAGYNCTNAGTQKVTVTVSGDDNFNNYSGEVSYTIGKNAPVASDFDYAAPSDLVYSGTAKSATVTVKPGTVGMGSFVVKYFTDSALTNEKSPVDVGTYYVGAIISAGDNYSAANVNVGSFEITVKTLSITVDEEKYYNGSKFVVGYGKFTTSDLVSGDAFTAGELTTTGVNAKDYTVQTTDWTITTALKTTKGIGNYNVVWSSVSMEIKKATPTTSMFSYYPPSDVVYSGTAKSATVLCYEPGMGTFVIKYYSDSGLTTEVTPIDVGKYYVAIDIDEGTNYTAKSKLYISPFTIINADPIITLVNKTVTYTGLPIAIDAATVTLKNSETYSGTITYTYYTDSACTEGATTTAPTNAGTYYVKATTPAFKNYNAGTSNVATLKINKNTPIAVNFDYTAPDNLVYNGKEKQATVTAKSGIVGMGAITVNYYSDPGLTTAATPINAGSYWVAIDVAAGDNYSAVVKLYINTFIVTQAPISISAYEVYYDGTTQFVRADYETGVNNEKIDLTYTTTGKNSGTYVLDAAINGFDLTYADPQNYSFSSVGNLTVKKIVLYPQLDLSGVSPKVYDGTVSVTGAVLTLYTSIPVSGEDPEATCTFELSSKNVGTKTVIAKDIALKTTPVDWTVNYVLDSTTAQKDATSSLVTIRTINVPGDITWSASNPTYSKTDYSSQVTAKFSGVGDDSGDIFLDITFLGKSKAATGHYQYIRAGDYTATASMPSAYSSNYKLSAECTKDYTIEQKDIEAKQKSGTIVRKEYDGTTTNITGVSNYYTFVTLETGDNVTLTATLEFLYKDVDVKNNKVNVSGLTLGGADALNYNLTTTSFYIEDAKITPKPLKLPNKYIEYNNVDKTLTFEFATGIGSEKLNITYTANAVDAYAYEYSATDAPYKYTAAFADGTGGGLASNYKVADSGNGKFTIAVALIVQTDTGYPTLDSAIIAVLDNQTIRLINSYSGYLTVDLKDPLSTDKIFQIEVNGKPLDLTKVLTLTGNSSLSIDCTVSGSSVTGKIVLTDYTWVISTVDLSSSVVSGQRATSVIGLDVAPTTVYGCFAKLDTAINVCNMSSFGTRNLTGATIDAVGDDSIVSPGHLEADRTLVIKGGTTVKLTRDFTFNGNLDIKALAIFLSGMNAVDDPSTSTVSLNFEMTSTITMESTSVFQEHGALALKGSSHDSNTNIRMFSSLIIDENADGVFNIVRGGSDPIDISGKIGKGTSVDSATFNVTGDVEIEKALEVRHYSALNITGDVNIRSALTVYGATAISGDVNVCDTGSVNVKTGGTVDITGSVRIQGIVDVRVNGRFYAKRITIDEGAAAITSEAGSSVQSVKTETMEIHLDNTDALNGALGKVMLTTYGDSVYKGPYQCLYHMTTETQMYAFAVAERAEEFEAFKILILDVLPSQSVNSMSGTNPDQFTVWQNHFIGLYDIDGIYTDMEETSTAQFDSAYGKDTVFKYRVSLGPDFIIDNGKTEEQLQFSITPRIGLIDENIRLTVSFSPTSTEIHDSLKFYYYDTTESKWVWGTFPTGGIEIDKTAVSTIQFSVIFHKIGTYEVKATVTDVSSSKIYDVNTVSFVIDKGKAVYSTAPVANDLTYDSTAQELLTEGTTTNGTFMYRLGVASFSDSVPKATDAGTYAIAYYIKGDSDHLDSDVEYLSATIAQADIGTNTNIAISPSSSTYTGYEITVTPTVTGLGVQDSDWIVISGDAGINAGTYTLVIAATLTGNFFGTNSATWSITKAAPSYDAPVAKDLTYTGLAQELITAGSAVGGTIQYKLGTGAYSSVIPTGINATTTYTVYYKVIGDANHSDISDTLISGVQIKAKTLSASDFDSVADYVFTGAAITPVPTAIWPATSGDYVTPISYSNNVNAGVATITLTGKSNYTGSAVLTFNILKKDLTVSATASKTFDNAKLSKAVSATGLVSGDTVSGTVSTVSAHAGIYTVKDQDWTFTTALQTTKGIQNYNVSYSVSLTINKAALSGVTITVNGSPYAYTGAEIKVNFSVSESNVADTDWYVVSGNAGTNVGSYTLVIGATDSGNFSGTKMASWSIGKAAPSYVAPVAKDLTYTGLAQELITAGSAVGGTIQYKLGTGAYSSVIPTGINATTTYTVYYKVIGDANHSDISETQITGVKIKAKTLSASDFDSVADYVFTGAEIKPVPTTIWPATSGDYVTPITYANNVNAGVASITLTGKSNYTGSATLYFNILKKDLTVSASASKTFDNAKLSKAVSATGLVSGDTVSGTVSTVSAHAGIYTVKDQDWTFTTALQTTKGIQNYNVSYSVSLTINKAALSGVTINNTGGTYTYSGTEIEFKFSVTGANVQASDWYVVSGNSGINAGDYTLTICATDSGNFSGTATKAWSIGKATAAFTTLPKAIVGLVYNGSAQELVTAGLVNGGTVWYKVDSGDYSTSIPTAVNAKTSYTVYYKVVGGTNYTDITAASLSVAILKAASTVTEPTVRDLTYNGSAQELVNAGSSSTGTLTYKLSTESSYTIVIPKGTDAGNYTVNYKVIGDANHEDLYGSVAVTISNKDIALAVVTLGTALTYNNTVQTQSVSSVKVDGLTVTYTVANNTGKNAGTYTLTITGTGNFCGTALKDFTIAKADIGAKTTVSVSPSSTGYTGYEIKATPTVTGLGVQQSDWSIVSGNAGTNVGTYTLVIAATDAGNFFGTNSGTWSIVKAAPSYDAPVAKDLTYTGLAQELITAGSAVGGTIQYKLGTGAYSSVIPTGINATTTYTVYYKVIGDANHSDISETQITGVKIKAKTLSASDFDSVADYVFTGAEIKPVPTTIWPATSGDYVTPITYANNVNAGVATITLTGKSNYTGSATLYFNILKKDLTVSASASKTFDNAKLSKAVSATGLVSGDAVSGTVSTVSAHAGIYTVKDQDWTFTTELQTTKGIQNYNVSYSVSLTINKAALSGVTINNEGGTYTYSGTEIEFKFSVTGSNVQASDWYVVSGNSGINAGDYTLTICATDSGNFSGTATKAWKIEKADAGYVSPVALDLTFTGLAQELITSGSTDSGTLKYKLGTGSYSTVIPTGINATPYTVKFKVFGDSNHKDSGEITVSGVQIKAKNISASDFQSVSDYVFTGAEIKPVPTAIWPMTDGYRTIAYSNNVNAGVAKITLTGQSNYTGSAVLTFNILQKSLENSMITIKETYTYNTNVQNVDFDVSDTAPAVITASDWVIVSGGSGKDAGKYTLVITGTDSGNYTGTAQKEWAIGKATPIYSAPAAKSLTYDGTAQALVFAGSTAGGEMVYALSLTDTFSTELPTAVNAGDYRVYYMIYGGNNYVDVPATSATKVDVKIVPKLFTSSMVSYIEKYVYNGTEQTVQFEVSDGTALKSSDYSVSGVYKATDAGSYDLILDATSVGKNYKGTVQITWTITPKDLDNLMISITGSYTFTGSQVTPSFTVYDGKGLMFGIDYELMDDLDVNAGEHTLVISGLGNYQGSAAKTWTLAPKDLSGAVVTVDPAQTYNGNVITQGVQSVTVSGIAAGTAVTYYVIDNTAVDAGSHILKVVGYGNFTGEQTAEWKIDRATQTIVFDNATVLKVIGCSPFVNPLTRSEFCYESIQFSSSDKSVADVDQSGTVTVYGAGKAVINAYAPETKNYTSAKASYTVDVESSKRIVTEPTIESKQYTGSLLKADVPASSLYTVKKNDGGVNIGTYDVVLTLTDPENYKWSTVDTADVTLPFDIVKKEQKFRFTDEKVVKVYGDADFTNPLIIDSLYSTITYSSVDKSVATVDQNGKVTIIAPGVTSIIATAPEGDVYAEGSALYTLVVDKATLTVTYLGEQMHCGDEFKGEISITGFVKGETADTAAGYSAPFVYNPHKTAGIYSLAPINGAADNYKFDYVSGTLLIEHKLSYHAEGTSDPSFAHYKCDGCGRIFIDENASIEAIMNGSYIEIIVNVDQVTVQLSEVLEAFDVIDKIKKDYPKMSFVVVFKSDSDGLILLKEHMEKIVANEDIIAVGFGTFNTDVTSSIDNIKKIGITGDYDFTAKSVQPTGKYAERFKDASVYDLKLGIGSSTISEFGSNVRLRLSYTLSYGQSADNVACYYLGEDAEKLGDATYDELTESITFTTGHFSLYAVTYEAPAPNENNDNLVLIIALAIIVILALIIIELYRIIKRRQHNGMQ